MPGNGLGDTSEEQPLQPRASMRAENDDIRVPLRSDVKYPGSWFTFANARLYLESCIAQRLCVTSDRLFRCFPLLFANFCRFRRISR